jgi:hypothetical protein
VFGRVRWRRLAPFESEPSVIAFAQTWPGRIVLAAIFGVLLYARAHAWAPLLWSATCAWLANGRYRKQVAALIGLDLILSNPLWPDRYFALMTAALDGVGVGAFRHQVQIGLGAIFIVVCWALILFAGRRRDSLLARRPVACLLSVHAVLLLLAASGLLHGIAYMLLWATIMALSSGIWFICYAIADSRGPSPKDAPPVPMLRSYWSGSPTPIGKGWRYLSRFEATTNEQLAITQLKGLRLLIWAVLLAFVLHVLTTVVHGWLGIPWFAAVMSRTLAGGHTAWYLCWASLISEFLENLLELAVWGHTAVAIARFAGFRLLRNTYRPLEATSIAEFWNRYYFYFKELLVDMFFYPTFMRWFRSSDRLRLCFATFMAACVGNMAYHFTRDSIYVESIGLKQSIIGFQTYAFYCVVLATGICVSQWRSRNRAQHTGWIRRRLVPGLTVMSFFCLLHVFDDVHRTHTLADHARFLLELFGVDQWM